MSQAQKIYEYMAETNNRAADTALVLALRRAEPPIEQPFWKPSWTVLRPLRRLS